MAQNYHKKSSSATKRRGEQRSSGFSVFVSGFILGVIACQILPYLLKSDNSNSPAIDSSIVEAPAAPDFQFPNLLKGDEINIPQSENKTKSDTQANPDTNVSYLLQVGSFKNIDEAESLRINLLLLNLPVFTEAFNTSSGGKLHRVLVGPFSNNQESSSARKKLMENDLDSLLLKRNNN
ncbi:MAG: SPOR domain-containing protein [Porticoccaceae bacterium]